MDDRSPTIAYAKPIDHARPLPNPLFFKAAIACWAIAAGVALLITLGFALTAWSPFILLGMLWLFGGGGLTVAALVFAGIYSSHAKAAGYPSPHTRGRAQVARLLPLSNAVLAFVLLIVGWLLTGRVSDRLTLDLQNPTAVAIDDVSVAYPNGSRQSLGSIPANGQRRVRFVVEEYGDLSLSITRADRSWTTLLGYFDSDSFGGGPRDPYPIALDAP